jgi:sRNA-binding carbon storage regulator CsrA
MLVVTRKEHESIRIEPVEGLDPSMTLREAFAQGAILVKLVHIGHRRVRLAIDAPPSLHVRRHGTSPETEAAPASSEADGGGLRTAGI